MPKKPNSPNPVFTFLFLSFIVLWVPSCQVGRYAWYNFANITDHKIFPSRPLPKVDTAFQFISPVNTKIPAEQIDFLDSLCKRTHTVSLLIIQSDTLLLERYYQQYDTSSIVASFSMAKSYTSALIGAAIADGFIQDVNEPITRYIPELSKQKGFDQVTILHLLQMKSGIKSNESYTNPFGQAAKLYYGKSVRTYLSHLQVEHAPGIRFEYRSINTQLLGLILERSTGQSVTDYLYNRIWKHLGCEYDASWSIDQKKDGLEKTFCCINARARDYAKFGRLYLENGNWQGKQVLPESWISLSTTPQDPKTPFYNYQWWFSRTGYYAEGILGQFIFVNPKKKLIIVRLGKKTGKYDWPGLFDTLSSNF